MNQNTEKSMNTSPQHDCLPGQVLNAHQELATVISQRQLADGTYAVRIAAPQMASAIRPGQFFMLRPANGTDPLLGRPFALYDTVVDDSGTPVAFEFAYHVIGKMTRLMSHWSAGEKVELSGPFGNGFPVYEGQHLLCVGGGIGYTPFLAVSREVLGQRKYGKDPDRYEGSEPANRVTFCYGSQTKSVVADLSDFDDLEGLDIHISTDDGTAGHHGLVTDLVKEMLARSESERPDGVYCCGPEPMMYAVARICAAANLPCWLSLETPMACGFGACFSCVTKVRIENNEWDYRRTCVEGPIFPAETLAIPE